MKTKETHMLDRNFYKIHLYNLFALRVKISRTEQRNLQSPMIDTVVEVHHVIGIQIETFLHKTDIVLILGIDTDMTELQLLHNLTDQDMTIIDEIPVLIVHHTDLLVDRHINEIHALTIDHVHSPETDNSRSSFRHLDLLLDQETLNRLDPDHILKQEIK